MFVCVEAVTYGMGGYGCQESRETPHSRHLSLLCLPPPLVSDGSKIVITHLETTSNPRAHICCFLEGFHELCKFLNPHTHAHHPHSHMLL